MVFLAAVVCLVVEVEAEAQRSTKCVVEVVVEVVLGPWTCEVLK